MAYKNHIISRLQKINKWFSRLSGYQCLKIIIEYKNIGIHLAEFKLALLCIRPQNQQTIIALWII